jgi:hypothetical protein
VTRSFRRQQALDFLAREHHRQSLRLLGALHVVQPRQFDLEHFSIQKQDRVQGLVLSRSGYAASNRKIAQKRRQLRGTHFAWMSFAMKEDEASHPVQISLLGTNAVMADANDLTNLVEQARRREIVDICHNPSLDRSCQRSLTGLLCGRIFRPGITLRPIRARKSAQMQMQLVVWDG